MIKTQVSNGRVLSTSTIPNVISVTHTGSLYSQPEKIPDKKTLLLCDWSKGEVFTFKPSSGQKKVRITGLSVPRSVSYFFKDNFKDSYYIICEQFNHRITVYNNKWTRIRRIGRRGSDDGKINQPESAIVSEEDTIIISDYLNHRVSEFSFNGKFRRHLLIKTDGINQPYSMSYYYPHLWLVHGPPFELFRYNLYR